jgi:murein DD-endopeptidase MepM/ murein hydrolase activator NlpD
VSLRNPTQGPRIVPFGVARTSADKLPNGRWAFRVTQRFADIDKYFGGKHGALDLGNYECGDLLLASVAGTIRNKRDTYGAMIVEIVEASGALVGYGHVRRFRQNNGAKVAKGAVIGEVGDTGLGGVCHCHFYRRNSSGVLVDPWPLLEQNATVRKAKFNSKTGPVNIRTGPGQQGGSMAPIFAVVKSGRIIRKSDGKDIGSAGLWFTARSPVFGATHGIGSHPKSWTPMFIGGAYRSVAYPLTTYQ